jgi:hypothetical protein
MPNELQTESFGQVANTSAWYSWGPGFKSGPGDRLLWLSYFVVFLSLFKQMSG